LISSHDLNHITEVCERIVLLDRGEIQKDTITTPETLSALESYFKSISEHWHTKCLKKKLFKMAVIELATDEFSTLYF